MSIRIIPCETCQGEGGISDETAWSESHRLCPDCQGACVIEAQVEPRTLDDLEQEDFDMIEAQLERVR